MEDEINKLCCGCLSSGRKMKSVRDWTDQAFIQLITEILMPLQDEALRLCWECEAYLFNFVKFKEQIQHCSHLLLEYAKNNHQPPPQTVSKLQVHIQNCVNINLPLLNEIVHVKNEQDDPQNDQNAELNIKHEDYSDDDRFLIDIEKPDIVEEDKIKKKRKKTDKVIRIPERFYKKIVLSSEEIHKERSLMEAKDEYVNSKPKCLKCILPFPNEDDLKEHVLTKHELHASKNITCSVCERTFRSEVSLAYHSRWHSIRWQCVLCSHRSGTERYASRHYKKTHTNSEMFDLATKAYQTYGEKLQDNIEIHETKTEELIPCQYCDKKFRWKTSLRKHLETHRIEAGHKRKPYCETCRLNFTTTSNLRKHVKTSSKHQIQLKLRKLKEDLPISTSDPTQQAKDIENIKLKINGQKELFPCPQCEKKFQWKGNLLRHLQSHAARANGDLVCVPCNRTFSSIATFKQHMKISRKHVSENEFKYMCSDCGKRFANKTNLRDHIDWEHLKNYTHTCNHCQKVFKTHTSLYLHKQVVHRLSNSEHLCDHCGKSFPNKTKLRSHIGAVHTRDSPYKCGTCSARFSWHSCLSRHMRRVHRNAHKNN